MTDFTPKPWSQSQDGGNFRVYGPEGESSGLIAAAVRPCDINLITSAPYMYAALEALVIKNDLVLAALAKADGK